MNMKDDEREERFEVTEVQRKLIVKYLKKDSIGGLLFNVLLPIFAGVAVYVLGNYIEPDMGEYIIYLILIVAGFILVHNFQNIIVYSGRVIEVNRLSRKGFAWKTINASKISNSTNPFIGMYRYNKIITYRHWGEEKTRFVWSGPRMIARKDFRLVLFITKECPSRIYAYPMYFFDNILG